MENQEKIKQSGKVFWGEVFLFSLTLVLGILAARKINEILRSEGIVPPPISFWQFLLYFFSATLFIFLISRFSKIKRGREVIFKGIFVLAVFWGGSLLLSLWLPDLLALFLTAVLIFFWLKKSLILIHDLAVILGIAGVGAFLGLRFTPWLVVIILAILSIYDFIAVYKTKHMIKMAKEMMATGSILALICPPRISDFKAGLKEVRPGGRFLILGGGDVAFPLLLCVSLVPEGVLSALIVAVFALAGLGTSFYFFISQRVRRPVPALPPIAVFSIIGFLVTLLI